LGDQKSQKNISWSRDFDHQQKKKKKKKKEKK